MGLRFLICDPQNKWQMSGIIDFQLNFKRDNVFIKIPHDFEIQFNHDNPLLTK
jgi:hypothetical protein